MQVGLVKLPVRTARHIPPEALKEKKAWKTRRACDRPEEYDIVPACLMGGLKQKDLTFNAKHTVNAQRAARGQV